jgi:flagellar basal-body rod protein FlgG
VTSFAKSLDEQSSITPQDDTSTTEAQPCVDFSQGLSFIETSRKLDVAIYGKGFFQIETPQGPVYTRNGMFHINENGHITDHQGRIVTGQAGPITVPTSVVPSQINISTDGSLSANGINIGKFKIVDFGQNQNELIPVGQSCYKPPEDLSSQKAENISIRQGYLESSNVKMVNEMVNMLMVSRLYEANMKFITTKKEASQGLMQVAMG